MLKPEPEARPGPARLGAENSSLLRLLSSFSRTAYSVACFMRANSASFPGLPAANHSVFQISFCRFESFGSACAFVLVLSSKLSLWDTDIVCIVLGDEGDVNMPGDTDSPSSVLGEEGSAAEKACGVPAKEGSAVEKACRVPGEEGSAVEKACRVPGEEGVVEVSLKMPSMA